MGRLRVCLLLWLTLLGAFPAWASSTILVLGDSLSAGYGVPRDQAWVTLLQNRLTQERYTARVVNASISGETTAGGKFTLKEVECLGACGGAPMMMVDKTYYENLTPAKVDEILNRLE